MRSFRTGLLVFLCGAGAAWAQLPGGEPNGGPGRRGGPGGRGDGIWLRNAVSAESPTFDPCNAHQPQTGEYHYHDNPVCLRLQLNDNIRKEGPAYKEQPGPWHHSPILGWAYDGNPIYGPYGYSNLKDAASPVARMRSGFHLRAVSQRHTLAAWAAAVHGVKSQLDEAQYGPDVDPAHPLGWYVEDYDFSAADLDVYNGRFTVTPDFPKGTYAYFVTIDEKGQPAFPYVLGRQYFGEVPSRRNRVMPGTIRAYGVKTESAPLLNSWMTRYSQESARVIDGHHPDEGAVSTWPGQDEPANPDVTEVLYSNEFVYVGGSGLASHTMGPWFGSDGRVFRDWPSDQNFQDKFPRHPQAAVTRQTNALGPLGRWVNGVAVFNMLDGASWSHSQKADAMSGPPGGPGGPGGRGGPSPPRPGTY
jgi:hypothetical protein